MNENYVNIPGPIATSKKYSNVDYWYGPYDSIPDACNVIPESLRGLGLTVGILEGNEVVEYWWKKGTTNNDLELKIEKYELTLQKFNVSIVKSEDEDSAEHLDEIRIKYSIGGKGLLPTVTITGTSIFSARFNFNLEYTEYIKVSTPGLYTFKIIVTDAIGTYFNPNGMDVTRSVSWGDIIVETTDTSYVSNLLPQKSAYYGKYLGIKVQYNPDVVSNVRICMFADLGLNPIYTFPNIVDNSGTINTTIALPGEEVDYGHDNIIYAVYIKGGIEDKKPIFLFSILLPGEFDLKFPKGIPTFGYSGTPLPITINLLYGGDEQGAKITSKFINISLNNGDELQLVDIAVNSTLTTYYTLPEITFNSDEESVSYTLNIELEGSTLIKESKPLEIRKITTPLVPRGDFYFNSTKSVSPQNLPPYYLTLLGISCFPTNQRQELNWNSIENTKILEIPYSHFNLDFNIKCVQNGENLPLITIYKGPNEILKVGLLKITSSTLFEIYLPNGLILPLDNSFVHIGFGYQRKDEDKYYSCIFINGEIAFSDLPTSTPDSSSLLIYFNNSFILSEFCISFATQSLANTLVNCVNLGGERVETYKLLLGSLYDLFYYNWLTTLEAGYTIPQGNLKKLLLIPVSLSSNDNTEEKNWWTELRNSLTSFGNNIKAEDEEKVFKTFLFVKFGKPTKNNKEGILSTRQLFHFEKDDKESRGLDKLCGVVCKYKFIEGITTTYDPNKYCIVQVLGTSTLAYPIPNFQFTFIKYDEGTLKFSLDTSVGLTYLSPTFTDLQFNDSTFTFNSLVISEETNLVAKADSMDSSHLNNTPTCIYFNSLVNTLATGDSRDLPEFLRFNFNKFDVRFLDAIVGSPILLEVDSNENSPNNTYDINVTLVTQFDSYGTFMFNTGKSAKSMGLSDTSNEIISLEGQSNLEITGKGQAGLFTLPETIDGGTTTSKDQEIINAFNKISLNISSTNEVSINTSSLNDNEKSLIINYLISSGAFESRSTIKDKTIINISNWDYYAVPILRMWVFVNKSSPQQFFECFDKVFDKNYAILYYIHLILFGQADNLGKNMMLDCKVGEDIWYIRPYDLDSEFGLTNNGYDDFPVYSIISLEHFLERCPNIDVNLLPENTFNKYNSSSSLLWKKFWSAFSADIKVFYEGLRKHYITPERIIEIGRELVNNKISKELYNIDFSLKHLGTNFGYLNKGGRFLNYKDWIEKRFMYVDSYFSYFKVREVLPGYYGFNWEINKTLVPIFYETDYQELSLNSVRYGYNDWTYDGVLDNNMLFHFNIVPEAVTYMSPIWSRLVNYFKSGLFKNILKYSGEFDINIFNNSLLNLREIEILGKDLYTDIGSDVLTLPASVRKLRLQKLRNSDSADIFLKILEDNNLEELYIDDCLINTLTLENLSNLRVLEINSSNDSDNNSINNPFYSKINTLNLNNLQLHKLKIGAFTKIGTLSIKGRTTRDNVIDLSGINCSALSFSDSTVEKLYIDLLYNLNGESYSGYDFKDGNLFKYADLVQNREAHEASNIQKKGEDGNYSYILLNANNCKKIFPSTSPEEFDTLNLLGCPNLNTFSCIGYIKLKSLKLPTTVKTLNLLFCINLEKLNSEEYIDFNGFTNLQSNSDYYYLEYTFTGADASRGLTAYAWYLIKSIGNSFNLMGCDSITKIANLTSVNNNFTGEYFVAGCRNLTEFIDCSLTFTNLSRSFKLTESLSTIPNTFLFNITDETYTTGAFCDSNIGVKNIMERLAPFEITASNMFNSVLIKENIGTEDNPIVLNWKVCSAVFSERTLSTMFGYNQELESTNTGRDYANTCLSSEGYGKSSFSSDGPVYNIYIKLPKATNVDGMFMSQNIDIKNVDTILEGNTSLVTALGFLAHTKQSDLINFASCSHLTRVLFCYANCINLPSNKIIDNCKLPNSVANVAGFLLGVNLTDFDVNGLFGNLTQIQDARSCFKNTYCNCSGNPFGNNPADISSIFAQDSEHLSQQNPGTISSLNWITSTMTAGNISPRNAKDRTIVSSEGAFEGKVITNFETVSCNNSNLVRMFKGSTINSFKNNNKKFVIKGVNSTSIFEEATFNNINSGDYWTLEIDNGVVNLSKAFKDSIISNLKLNITSSNNIENLSYFFSGTKGTVGLEDNLSDTYEFFPRVKNISHLFDASPKSALIPESRTGLDFMALPDYLFKKSLYLEDISYFCKDILYNKIFDLSNCSKLLNLDYAWANSSIQKLPNLPATLNSLNSIKGAFRRINFQLDSSDTSSITFYIPSLVEAEEVFAESTSNRTITVSMGTCSLLKNVNAFSTNSSINLTLANVNSQIVTAYLPNLQEGVTAGTLQITGTQLLEETKQLNYTLKETIKWSQVITNRIPNATADTIYNLAGNKFTYLL